MKLTITSIEKDGIIRVACDGSILADDFPADAKNPMAQLLGDTWSANRVILNLDKTHFIDSYAIGWLINTTKEFKAHGGALVIYGVRTQVRKLLELLKIEKVVPMADTEATARSLISKGA